MRHSLFAITALFALVFVLIAGQSYLSTDRKFSVIREMAGGLDVVSDRDGKLFFRLQNDSACGGDKYFYDDEALYSKHDGADEPGTLILTNIIDLKTLKMVKFYADQPLVTLEDSVYEYSIVPMHCCFNLFAEKKLVIIPKK